MEDVKYVFIVFGVIILIVIVGAKSWKSNNNTK